MGTMPNAVAICKENLEKSVDLLVDSMYELVSIWIACIISHIEKLFASQSRSDFAPRTGPLSSHTSHGTTDVIGHTSDSLATLELTPSQGTTTCEAVCKVLGNVITATKSNLKPLGGSGSGGNGSAAEGNYTGGGDGRGGGGMYRHGLEVWLDWNKLFWAPFGQRLVGSIITHLRKQRVTPEGATTVVRDLQLYRAVSTSHKYLVKVLRDSTILSEPLYPQPLYPSIPQRHPSLFFTHRPLCAWKCRRTWTALTACGTSAECTWRTRGML